MSVGLRFSCLGCGAALPGDAIAVEGARVTGRCPGCGERAEHGPPTTAARGDDAEHAPPIAAARGDDGERCPKCDAPAPGDACARCGLARERFAAFVGDDEAPASGALRRAWEQVEAAWEDDAGHAAFVERAALEGAFRDAARRYRRAGRERDDGRAEAQLDRIRRMAEAAILARPVEAAASAEPEPEPYRRLVVLLIALVALAGAGGVYAMWHQLRSEAEAGASERPPQRAPGAAPAAPPPR